MHYKQIKAKYVCINECSFLHLKVGIDICKEAVATAIKWARDGANASLLRLQKIEAANEFADFVDRLIQGNIRIFRIDFDYISFVIAEYCIYFV